MHRGSGADSPGALHAGPARSRRASSPRRRGSPPPPAVATRRYGTPPPDSAGAARPRGVRRACSLPAGGKRSGSFRRAGLCAVRGPCIIPLPGLMAKKSEVRVSRAFSTKGQWGCPGKGLPLARCAWRWRVLPRFPLRRSAELPDLFLPSSAKPAPSSKGGMVRPWRDRFDLPTNPMSEERSCKMDSEWPPESGTSRRPRDRYLRNGA